MISDHTVSSPLFVPDSLKFYVNRLSFSKNRVRLQALSSDTATQGSQVIVRLPSNTMINLASLTMTGAVRAYFDGTANASDGVALPTNWDFSFIETLSLIANGGIITQPFTNYKLLGHILNDIHGNQDVDLKRAALQGSLPQPYQGRGNGNAADAQGGWQPFAINNWLSATQTMMPSYISTNLLGDLELRLTMTDNSILPSGRVDNGNQNANPGRERWEMKNISFYIETASIGNNLVDQAVAAKLAAGEPINVPFENVFSFSQSNNDATFNQRFSVSSQSVNKIIVTTQLDADIALGTRKRFINGIPQAFRRNANTAISAQFSVNNQYSPNYQIDSGNNGMFNTLTGQVANKDYRFSNALVETRAAMDIPDYDYDCADKLCSTTQMPVEFFGAGIYDDVANQEFKIIQRGSTQLFAPLNAQRQVQERAASAWWDDYDHRNPLDTYLLDKFVLATSFDFDVADKDRIVSGINTLGSNAQMFYNQIGTGGAANRSTIYVLCTSMIQIYAGATLKIIQ